MSDALAHMVLGLGCVVMETVCIMCIDRLIEVGHNTPPLSHYISDYNDLQKDESHVM